MSVIRQEKIEWRRMRNQRDLGMGDPEENGFWATTSISELPSFVMKRKWTM